MAFIILENEIRETAKDTFEYFKQQGVAIKVISGDNPVTASRVAIKAGIENATHYVDATTLKTDDDITQAVEKYTVFGRVIPEQKKKIIEAFKAAGNVVAMTGDGVNDVLAVSQWHREVKLPAMLPRLCFLIRIFPRCLMLLVREEELSIILSVQHRCFLQRIYFQ